MATDVPYVKLEVAATALLTDDEVKSLGLVPVFHKERSVLAAYARDPAMSQFGQKLHAYETQQQKVQALAKIESVTPWSRGDRLSPQLAALRISHAETYTVDLLLLPMEDEEPNRQGARAIATFVTRANGVVLDQAITRTFAALRIRVGGQSLEALLDYRDDIALVDLPPKANILVPLVEGLALDEIPEVPPPPDTAPAICVVDSGIVEGHPLLEPAILAARSRSYPAALGPPVPRPPVEGAGHGTRVAGVALYSDVATAAATKTFAPAVWLVNARVLDDDADFHPERMPFMRDVVEHTRDRCRVFNLSYGLEPCDHVLSAQAVELDDLAREFNVLFVLSSGNAFAGAPDEDAASVCRRYPKCLIDADRSVLRPAEALTALTVGSITPERETARSLAAPPRAPSIFSLAGGLKNVVKPELCELGGNNAVDGTPPRWVTDAALGIPTTSHRIANGQLLEFDSGTSIAAPRVAHLAARIVARYPDATTNLLRGLLVSSAMPPGGVVNWEPKDVLAICGFGVPDADRALFCRPHRATLLHEGEIGVDEVQIFDIPVPVELSSAKGTKGISVTIAYDPPVSLAHRERPAGVDLTWGLARGDVRVEVLEASIAAEADREAAGEQGASKGPRRKSPFMAGDLPKRPQQRGTVQKNSFTWQRGQHGDTYRLAITARAIRPKHSGERQRFAAIVSLECESVDVYAAVRARLAAGRVRVRVSGGA